MKTLVVYSRSSTQRPRSVVASLCDWLIRDGHDVTVVDVSDFSYINQDLPPRWFAKLAGHDVYPGKLDEVLGGLGVKYHTLKNRRPAAFNLPESVALELADAIHSDLVTYFNSDVVDTTRNPAQRVQTNMHNTSGPLFVALSGLLETGDYQHIYIPNGRVPEQRMALEAAKKAGLDIRYYEIGRAKPHSFYAGKTQVHDREGTQREVDEVLAGMSKAEITSLARQWLNERTAKESTLNVYSAGWENSTQPTAEPTEMRKAIFFSSSVDEFASYGDAWALHAWADQYEAFDHIMSLLEKQGVQCQLRIHPNLANKSRSYFHREIGRINELQGAHPTLRVWWHNEPVNSYHLVQASDYIVVGRSTLGLEASLMGKCVWTTTAARYDEVADVRSSLSPEDVTASHFALWDVDPHGAERFVAYWSVQDHEFSCGEQTWATWDSFRAPQLLRIGQLFVSNPLSHKIHLVLMELTRRRNLRFSAKRL